MESAARCSPCPAWSDAGESSASSSSACRRTSTRDSSARRRSSMRLPVAHRPRRPARMLRPTSPSFRPGRRQLVVSVSPATPGGWRHGCRPSSQPLPRAPAIRSRGPSRPQGRSARVSLHGTWFRPTARHARPQFGQRATATRPRRGSRFGDQPVCDATHGSTQTSECRSHASGSLRPVRWREKCRSHAKGTLRGRARRAPRCECRNHAKGIVPRARSLLLDDYSSPGR